jgi:hypothetical protein
MDEVNVYWLYNRIKIRGVKTPEHRWLRRIEVEKKMTLSLAQQGNLPGVSVCNHVHRRAKNKCMYQILTPVFFNLHKVIFFYQAHLDTRY